MPSVRLRYTRDLRLVRQGDFRAVFQRGSRARGDWMTVAVLENSLPRSRLGLSVGKGSYRRAVRRNRIRRLFREAFRLGYPALPRGLDIVLIASTPNGQPRLEQVRAELARLVAKAHARALERRAREAASGGPGPARPEGGRA